MHFPSSLFTANVLWKTQEMAFPRPQIFSESMPQDSHRFGVPLVSKLFFPCMYQYLIAYEINAQGWKKRLGLEGVRGGGGGGGVHYKKCYCQGGYLYLYLFICHTITIITKKYQRKCKKKWRGGLKETIKLMLIRPPQFHM